MTSSEKEKKLRLMLRQVKDAQVQAGNILAGNNSRANIETFARFCTELNDYIRKYEDREEVACVLNEMPEIQYKLVQNSLWGYLFSPWWLTASRKKIVTDQIRLVREKYAKLELRLRGITVDSLT